MISIVSRRRVKDANSARKFRSMAVAVAFHNSTICFSREREPAFVLRLYMYKNLNIYHKDR
jgi:hypothetical protein